MIQNNQRQSGNYENLTYTEIEFDFDDGNDVTTYNLNIMYEEIDLKI